jgi:nucleotide-binding universal stress UspA family protein
MKKLILVLSNISFSSASVEYAIKKSEEEGYGLITIFVLDEEIPESVSSLLMYIGFLGPKPTSDLKTTILEEYKKRAYSELARVEQLAKEKGLTMRTLLREGTFVDEILAVQEEENATLVIASKPRAPLLSQVLTSFNMAELKEKLGDTLVIIEE